MNTSGLTVAVVGLGFGADFVPIYLSHPDVARVVLVDPNSERLREVSELFGVQDCYRHIDDVLRDPGVDAVHILAPVQFHADLAVAVLNADKHCACAVPMATSLTDLERIVAAQATSNAIYMMMETSVYSREYLTVAEMYRRGEIGDVTLYRGFHIQNLDGFPDYWQGYPPMHYLTHALSPALALLGTTVVSVQCQGAGRLTPERKAGNFDNPYPAEIGLFRLDHSDALVDITMSFFQSARAYIEGFTLYGEHRGIEWPQANDGAMMQFDMFPPAAGHRGNPVETRSLTPRDFPELLPTELSPFVRTSQVQLPGMPTSTTIAAHHGGSHPHLVNEFVSSIVDGRAPFVDATRAAEWTAPGICAHQSALNAGETVLVPRYR